MCFLFQFFFRKNVSIIFFLKKKPFRQLLIVVVGKCEIDLELIEVAAEAIRDNEQIRDSVKVRRKHDRKRAGLGDRVGDRLYTVALLSTFAELPARRHILWRPKYGKI